MSYSCPTVSPGIDGEEAGMREVGSLEAVRELKALGVDLGASVRRRVRWFRGDR